MTENKKKNIIRLKKWFIKDIGGIKIKVKDLICENLIYNIVFIILGFILMRNVNMPNEKFELLCSIFLTFIVVFVVTHMDSLKEFAKQIREGNRHIVKFYFSIYVELILIIMIVFLMFLGIVFNFYCLNYIILSIGFGLLSALLYTLLPIHYIIIWLYRKFKKENLKVMLNPKKKIKKLMEDINKQKKIKRELIFLYNEAINSEYGDYLPRTKYFVKNETKDIAINLGDNKIYDLIEELAVLTDLEGGVAYEGYSASLKPSSGNTLTNSNLKDEFKVNLKKYNTINNFSDFSYYLIERIVLRDHNTSINLSIMYHMFIDRYKKIMYGSVVKKSSTEEDKNILIFTIIRNILEKYSKLNNGDVTKLKTEFPFFVPFAESKKIEEIRAKFNKFFDDLHVVSLGIINDRIEEIRIEIDNIEKHLERIEKFIIFILALITTAVTTAMITAIVEKMFQK